MEQQLQFDKIFAGDESLLPVSVRAAEERPLELVDEGPDDIS